MNKHLKELINVSLLDKEVDLLEPKILEIKKNLFDKEYQVEKREQEITQIQELKHECELGLQKSNQALETLGERLEEFARKLKEVKTEKELKALNIEEELVREQITHHNNEIARLEALQASHDEKITQIQTEISGLQTQIAEIQEQVQAQMVEIQKTQEKIFQKKEALVINMDQKIVSFYEKIRKWAKNTSVVPVYKQACGGCFIKISDRIYTDILKGEDIITCPHCGRILYVEQEN